jgi:Tfp pilus assembly protein PilF
MDRIQKITEFLRENPTDSFLQHALALEYIKIGEDVQARRLFEEILARDPGYIGSYYHLGKLLERMGEPSEAIKAYENGITRAREAGERHALSELMGALEELTD